MKCALIVIALVCLALPVAGQTGKMVGKKSAPYMNLTALDGKMIQKADLVGKVVVYNLWYLNCPPCRTEIPELNAIVEEYKGKDVVFIGLSTDNKHNLEDFLKDVPFAYQIVPAAGQIILLNFGTTQEDGSLFVPFPTHVVVNRQGFIELQVAGKKGVGAVRDELKRQFPESATGTAKAN